MSISESSVDGEEIHPRLCVNIDAAVIIQTVKRVVQFQGVAFHTTIWIILKYGSDK